MLRRFAVIGLAAVFMAAAAVEAQERQRGKRGGQRGQRGGVGQRGGGFGGFQRGRGGGGMASILTMKEVHDELKLNEDQVTLLQDMQSDLREQMRASFGNFNPRDFQNLSEEERRARMDEMRKKGAEIQKKGEEMIAMILEPKQLERANQLRLQREGLQALQRPEIAKKLGVSKEQLDKMKDIREKADQERQEAFRSFRDLSQEERTAMFEKFRNSREETEKTLLAVLSDKQRADFEKMKGKEFDFPRQQFGGRGGNSGRPRRPGGDGGERPRRPID